MKNAQTNFMYAIREVLLVVIGILIAVSINNWNEKRKQDDQLDNILLTIKEDLSSDITKINEILAHYERLDTIFKNVLADNYTIDDYEETPQISFLLLGYPELSLNKRGFLLLEKFNGHLAESREEIVQEVVEFYNKQLLEVAVDDELRADDFKENFSHWKNNTNWWLDYVQFRVNEDFISYAVNDPDYKTRVATAQFFAYVVYLPEIEKFKDMGEEIISQIELLVTP